MVDSNKCISYATIELRAPELPEEMDLAGWLYGCDVCQDVCPWNVRFATALAEESPYAAREALGGKDARALAIEILDMSQDEFTAAFKGSPMKRARLRGLKRNAAVVLGNVGTAEEMSVLVRALDDPEALIAEHAEWAMERIRLRTR